MRKHEHSFAPVLSAKVLAAMVVTITTYPAFAADTCLTKPNLRADGGHWYYRYDRVNHRRCWYQEGSQQQFLQASGQVSRRASRKEIQDADSPPPAATPQARPQPSITAWLSSIVAAITGTSSTGAKQDVASHESPIVQTTPENALTRRWPATRRVDPVDTGIQRIESRETKVVEATAAPALASVQPSIQQGLSPSQQWSMAQESAPSLQVVRREILFQEFLRWQERRSYAFW
jgi:hypothetical protein